MSAAGECSFQPPQVFNDDLSKFFQAHFSDGAVKVFGSQFSNRWDEAGRQYHGELQHGYEDQSEAQYWEGEDDGLGYYPDGVKRTLTDEEIEIFRHSELHALRRERERAATTEACEMTPSRESRGSGERSTGRRFADRDGEGELQELPAAAAEKTRKRKRKGKNTKPFRREPKPDLRKRTWDIVETGLESLDYD